MSPRLICSASWRANVGDGGSGGVKIPGPLLFSSMYIRAPLPRSTRSDHWCSRPGIGPTQLMPSGCDSRPAARPQRRPRGVRKPNAEPVSLLFEYLLESAAVNVSRSGKSTSRGAAEADALSLDCGHAVSGNVSVRSAMSTFGRRMSVRAQVFGVWILDLVQRGAVSIPQ